MRKRPDYGNATPGDLARALMTGTRRKPVIRNQAPVCQTLPDQIQNHPPHLSQSVKFTEIVLPRKLPNVAVKMLRTDLMEDPAVRPLQKAPQ